MPASGYGGTEGKVSVRNRQPSGDARRFLEKATVAMIRRMAEKAHGPSEAVPHARGIPDMTGTLDRAVTLAAAAAVTRPRTRAWADPAVYSGRFGVLFVLSAQL